MRTCEDPQPEWLTQSQQSITDVVLITSEEAITGDSFLASHTVTRVGQSIMRYVKTRAIYRKKKQADSAYTVIYLYNRGENLRVMENLSNVASQAPSLMGEIKKKAHSQTSWEAANRNQLVSLWTKT